jgi:lysophospholipase L1-like esterase
VSHPARSIFCYGDSITAGVRGISYVDRLKTVLPEHSECFARGIPGATALTLEQSYSRLAPPPESAPELLILTVGTNEALGTFSPHILRVVRRIRGRPVVVRAVDFQETLLRWLSPLAPRLKVAFCGLAFASRDPRLAARARELNAVLADAAATLDGLFVDINQALAHELESEAEALIPFSRLRDSLWARLENRLRLTVRRVDNSAITFDGVHFAPRGAGLYAQTVRRAIAPFLPPQSN